MSDTKTTPLAPTPEELAKVATANEAKIAELTKQLADLKAKAPPEPQQHGQLVSTIQSKDTELTLLRQKVDILEKNQKAIESTKLASTELLEAKATATTMPICDCRVHLDKNHDLPKIGVTPAEVVLLVAQFHKQKGDMPVHAMEWHKVTTPELDDKKKIKRDPDTQVAHLVTKEVKEVTREAHQEIGRLKSRYGAQKVEALFPGANPTLPQTFKSALQMGMSVAIPGASLSKDQGGDKLGAIVINA